MTTSLSEGKERFEDLVNRAIVGEEVLIVVDGKVRARLTLVDPVEPARGQADMQAWARDLRARLNDYVTGVSGLSSEQIIDELREERF